MRPSLQRTLRICSLLLLGAVFLGILYLWPPVAALVGLGLVVFYTLRYLRSLPQQKPSFWKKTWEWLKNVWDSISGIG